MTSCEGSNVVLVAVLSRAEQLFGQTAIIQDAWWSDRQDVDPDGRWAGVE